MSRQSESIAEVVKNGLCIGCGLCEAVTEGRVQMELNLQGSLRPTPADTFDAEEERAILASCPGVTVQPRSDSGEQIDDVWGEYRNIQYAWANDPEYRHRGSAGGAVSALGAFLLNGRHAKHRLKKIQNASQT